MFTTLYINFSDAQGQITPESVVVYGRNLNSSKFQCMSSISDSIKKEGARVVTIFFPYRSMGIFSDAQGQLTPQSFG